MGKFRTIKRSVIVLSITLLSVLLAGAPLILQAATIDAFDRGYYNYTGYHDADLTNTLTSDFEYNSFFTFDLTGETQPFSSGFLTIEVEETSPSWSTGTLSLYDVTTAVNVLTTSHASGPEGVAIFNDLQTGNIYGTETIWTGGSGYTLTINLSDQMITDINASLTGDFAFGANVDCEAFGSDWILFNYDTPKLCQLTLVEAGNELVPEPATSSSSAVGLRDWPSTEGRENRC